MFEVDLFLFSAPNEKMTELLKKTIKEAKDMICKVNYTICFVVML